MQLLVIRHGLAVDREEFARTCPDDGLRPLTKEGKKKMRRGARGLRTLVQSLDVLASSPLTRAVQTAEIVAEVFGVQPIERSELVPSRPPGALLKWLQRQPPDAVVAVVGHEPHLSLCASWLVRGLEESFVELKKGAACLIEFPDKLAAGHGRLRWLMTSRQLRRLKGG